ncbi:MAG TPA: hypothetical protein VIT88_15085 [Pyrinomonadaceae bacterium]
MTPEQRLDRLESVVKLMIKAGLRARKQSRDQDAKINILIHSQMETSDQISRMGARTEEVLAGLAAKQTKTEEALASLTAKQAKTDDALRAYLNSLRRGRNGKH